MRLDKFLSESSIGRRKEVRIFIKDGKVKVNSEIVIIPAYEIDEENDRIEYLDEDVEHNGKMYYMFHKPFGCITARKDSKHQTVMDYFECEDTKGLFPVGRLDKDTEGLLFLTNDGEFNHQLMYPDQHVKKTYYFWAFGTLDDEQINKLENGIVIRDGEPLTKPAKIEILKTGLFRDLQHELKDIHYEKIKINPQEQSVLEGHITISEGRKHQVRRMLKAAGCYVVYLKRISIGEIILDETLQKGQYREMTREEVTRLKNGG
ncbi:MAG: pseudouridine synthase [Lachnospiraceae bacterium]|nr:pseudouridine synthase [Lachnospiraceae bacterium]MDD3660252.1 pseudouridine synthase [Lachnospiraceae bacterium]